MYIHVWMGVHVSSRFSRGKVSRLFNGISHLLLPSITAGVSNSMECNRREKKLFTKKKDRIIRDFFSSFRRCGGRNELGRETARISTFCKGSSILLPKREKERNRNKN